MTMDTRLQSSLTGPSRELGAGSVLQGIADRVGEAPTRPAISQDDRVLDYSTLWGRAGAVAAALRARGVVPGRIVAYLARRSPDSAVALLGIWRAGAAYLPLDPEFPQERLRFMLEDSGVSLVVTDGVEVPPGWEAASVALGVLTEFETPEPSPPLPDPAADDLAYLIYTSGSTGRPKGVQVTHGNLLNLVEAMAEEPGLVASDVFLAVTTFSFDIAAMEMWLPLWVGARVEVAREEDQWDGEWLGERLERCGATVMQATPATWRILLEAGWSGRLRLLLCGGEAFPRDLVPAMLSRAEQVWNLYGPTETTIWSTLHRVEPDGTTPIPIGRPILNTQVYIVDQEGALCPPQGEGEVWIGGDGVAPGYLHRPELNASRFLPDPFRGTGRVYRTGDLGRIGAHGFLEHLGRGDDQVKVMGYRIELGEIEAAISAQEGVRQAVAVVQGEDADSRLVAFAVPSGQGPLDGRTLRAALRSSLPDYMIPAAIHEIGEVPLTPNGKVDRRALTVREIVADREEPAAPEGPIETTLAAVWEEILHVSGVGRDDNFFDLGGTSLQAIRVVSRLESLSAVRIDPRLFFFMNLRQLAALGVPVAGS